MSQALGSPIWTCWKLLRIKIGSMSTRPVTSKIVSGSGPGAFRASLYTLFKIDPTRSGENVLIEVLGVEFNGVLGCDYYSAYRRYLRTDVSLQFCLAHLIRDVKFLTTLPDARDRM